MTLSRAQLPEFFNDSNGMKMHLKIGYPPLNELPVATLQNQENLRIFPPHGLIELPPVFSHMSFLLIECLSVTQHGEFSTRSKKGSHETFVELGGHTNHRYPLSKKELEEIQQMYEQIMENWIGWRLQRKKN